MKRTRRNKYKSRFAFTTGLNYFLGILTEIAFVLALSSAVMLLYFVLEKTVR